MARRSRVGTLPVRSGNRARYEWSGSLGNVALANGASTGIFTLVTLNIPATLMRVRGNLLVMMDVGAANDTMSVCAGIYIASDAQVTAGAAAFPSPFSIPEADWLWHQHLLLRSESGTQADADQLGGQIVRTEIDSKAMRKIRPNQNLMMVFDGAQLAGTPTYDIMVGIRALFKTD